MYDVDVVVKQDIKMSLNKMEVYVSKEYKEFIDDRESRENKKIKV